MRCCDRRQKLGIKAELTADATAMGKFEHVWLIFAGLFTAASGVEKLDAEQRNGFCRLPVIAIPKVTIAICLSQGAIEHKVYMSCVVRFEGTLSRGTYMPACKAVRRIS
ncbi:hypothetical protein Baya_9015 [Bagarius yarrelli]|uniref:Uncharacterized protein n=1 Tax=Bagarius yarrelli TaxID=175774 RepID=A0A556U758_BAGYA|nr:hypothetical protein Baya_9015 [Bagarius yarrelli]